MTKLLIKSIGREIEVDQSDAGWYNGHEDYEVIEDVETAETIETESWETPKKEVLTLRKPGRPRKNEIQATK